MPRRWTSSGSSCPVVRRRKRTRCWACTVGVGSFCVVFGRPGSWQVGYVILKGNARQLREQGLEKLRQSTAEMVPALADRMGTIQDWSQCHFLNVESSRLERWYRPGLLLIGDAAHVMSPVGGVGINYAIQDAVATANLLGSKLGGGTVAADDLAVVQRRRELPTRFIQGFQATIQKLIVRRALSAEKPFTMPLPAPRDHESSAAAQHPGSRRGVGPPPRASRGLKWHGRGRSRTGMRAGAKAKTLCRLNAEDVRKAKKLGMRPRALIGNIPNSSQQWKAPVRFWIRDLYAKRFGEPSLSETEGGGAGTGRRKLVTSVESNEDGWGPGDREASDWEMGDSVPYAPQPSLREDEAETNQSLLRSREAASGGGRLRCGGLRRAGFRREGRAVRLGSGPATQRAAQVLEAASGGDCRVARVRRRGPRGVAGGLRVAPGAREGSWPSAQRASGGLGGRRRSPSGGRPPHGRPQGATGATSATSAPVPRTGRSSVSCPDVALRAS